MAKTLPSGCSPSRSQGVDEVLLINAKFFSEGGVPWMGHDLEADMGSNTKETNVDVSPYFVGSCIPLVRRALGTWTMAVHRCAIHLFGCSALYNFCLNVGVSLEIGV
jgi:hypothetical protein